MATLELHQGEPDIHMRQAQSAHDQIDLLVFRALGFEKFAPRRRVEKQIPYLYRCALIMGNGTTANGCSTMGFEIPARVNLGLRRTDFKP